MNDFQVRIVVEGKQFLPIVEAVLADAVRDMQVDWVASDYSAFGHARSGLFMRHRPVLLVVNSEFNDPAEGEYRRSILYRGLYDVADREFWEVAMADPNLEAWHVANGREAAELIAKTPDLQAAVAFLERVKNGAVVAAG
jgi:hypothetical protein